MYNLINLYNLNLLISPEALKDVIVYAGTNFLQKVGDTYNVETVIIIHSDLNLLLIHNPTCFI